jgi:hypothetical protein
MEPEGSGAESVQNIFYRANFVRDLDIRLDKVSEGICETSLVVQDRLRQQHGFVHGGVIATLADHTAGGAALWLYSLEYSSAKDLVRTMSYALRRSSSSSGVRGQSWRNKRLRDRSASNFPPVWQCGQ